MRSKITAYIDIYHAKGPSDFPPPHLVCRLARRLLIYAPAHWFPRICVLTRLLSWSGDLSGYIVVDVRHEKRPFHLG